ncbi:MAG: cytochrome c3 family protein [Acidobacteriales bacterium]|nr:cytochrome c3 family protein [Terriglobales bacterium]
MAQFFPHSANAYAKMSIALGVILMAGLGLSLDRLQRSPWVTKEGIRPEQPVPFSHNHHVAGLGIDCRYCHTSVETSSFAGLPPTKTCMNCHSQIWTNAIMLEPVRASFRDNKPLRWTRVHDLPDFAYFSHEIHVNKGIGCKSCHGPVDQMPLMYQNASLQMEWCLQCHRNTEQNLRPKEEVFNMKYEPPSRTNAVVYAGKTYLDQITLGKQLQIDYHIRGPRDLTSCETCHR